MSTLKYRFRITHDATDVGETIRKKVKKFPKFREEDLFDDVESGDDDCEDAEDCLKDDEIMDMAKFVKTEVIEDDDNSNDVINLNWCRGCGNHNAAKPKSSLAEIVGDLAQVSLNEIFRLDEH